MRVAALICPNGLGHFRRVVRILSQLRQVVANVSVDLVCEQWQLDRTADDAETKSLVADGVQIHTEIMSPGIAWSPHPSRYRDGRLLSWERRLADCEAVRSADHVLSDNLGGVLSVRPDAVLSGSFLWGDILATAHPDERSVREFAEHERALFADHRPPMLCVDDIAMPAVAQFTERVGLPWMCERMPRHDRVGRRPRVAVLGGATGADDELLRSHIATLNGTGRYELSFPRGLSSGDAPLAFGHTLADYAELSAVVCRPGVGTMTDCVATGVPMVCVYDSNNPELSHNAGRIEILGLGADIGRGGSDEVQHALDSLIASDTATQHHFSELRTGGALDAARWLAEHWGLQRLVSNNPGEME